MTTLNAKANNAYNELIAAVEQDPDYVWAGFDHERAAFETGYETGHKAAQPVVDRAVLGKALSDHEVVWRGEINERTQRCACGWMPDSWETADQFDEYYREHRTDAVLALLNEDPS